jgi:hypothetical protein
VCQHPFLGPFAFTEVACVETIQIAPHTELAAGYSLVAAEELCVLGRWAMAEGVGRVGKMSYG